MAVKSNVAELYVFLFYMFTRYNESIFKYWPREEKMTNIFADKFLS